MRAIDSPSAGNGWTFPRFRGAYGARNPRMFRYSARYKQTDPHISDCDIWLENVLDYQISTPPGYR